VLLNF